MEEVKPDVVVTDIAMPYLNGVDATRQITARYPAINVVVLSMHSDESYVLRALKTGARGYVVKESGGADLVNAIQSVHAGRAFFSVSINALLMKDHVRQMRDQSIDDSYELLSLREREVLQLIAEAKSNNEIANLLNLSIHTIETHRGNILQKLNLHSVAEVILYAVKKGLLPDCRWWRRQEL